MHHHRLCWSVVGCFVLALAALFTDSCLPYVYRAEFPSELARKIPARAFSESAEVLVVPCWYWLKSGQHRVGPPVVLQSGDLFEFPERLRRWRGVDMVSLFGHEGHDGPQEFCVSLIGDDGAAVRFDYVFDSAENRFFWETLSSHVGMETRDRLRAFFTSVGTDAPAKSTLCRGRTVHEVLGTPESLAEAARFTEELVASGDDVWHRVDEGSFP